MWASNGLVEKGLCFWALIAFWQSAINSPLKSVCDSNLIDFSFKLLGCASVYKRAVIGRGLAIFKALGVTLNLYYVA